MKRKKTKRRVLLNKLEAIWKLKVKQRDKYTCQYCKVPVQGSNCHAHHIKPKSIYRRMAYDISNGITLCYKHHLQFAHLDSTTFTDWFRKTYPKVSIYIEKRAKEPTKPIKDYELEEWIKAYED